MMQFLALHTPVTIPALMALLGGLALTFDIYVIRPGRRKAEARRGKVSETMISDKIRDSINQKGLYSVSIHENTLKSWLVPSDKRVLFSRKKASERDKT